MNNNLSKEEIINQAFQFHSQGNIQEATKYYQSFINQGFEDYRVFSNYGVILKDLGKLKEAEVSTRRAIQLNPNLAIAHSNLGNILIDLGKLKEAEVSTHKAIQLNPNNALAHSNLGSILTNLGKLKEAEVSTRKAIQLNPDLVIAHSNLGSILKDLGKLKEAEVSTHKAIQLNPNNALSHSNLGSILQDLGKLQEAEVSTRKAIQLNPNNALSHSNLGSILQDLGNLQEAEVSTRKAIQLNPDLALAHSNLGSILKDLGKLKEAEVSTRKAIQLNPNNALAHSNLGSILIDLGNLQEAEVSTRKAIQLNPNNALAHSNLGSILIDLGNLQEAEVSTRKAIQLNPNNALAHSNLGSILIDLGKLQDAELSICKAIELNPDLAIAFYLLSTLKLSNKNKIWRNKLFSKNLLNNKSKKDKVNIYFARANILHKESNFKESSRYLQFANNLKKNLNPTNFLLRRSKELILETNKEVVNEDKHSNFPESIFIVGMPRSGSTLLESILSMNNNVNDLGEKNIFEESYLNWKNPEQNFTLADLYFKKTNTYGNKLRTTTNKWLLNYLYTGIISTQIPNAKIIHCFRNPLDNILSIYRTNFTKGTQYSSSLIDSAKVYLDQEEVMTQYKKRFKSKIYDLNYDLLVSNPTQEIKSLIKWLGWKWDDQYYSPHLNPRSVSTASNVQVRSPINSKSTGGWKKYKEMLRPAMEIITQKDIHKDLKY